MNILEPNRKQAMQREYVLTGAKQFLPSRQRIHTLCQELCRLESKDTLPDSGIGCGTGWEIVIRSPLILQNLLPMPVHITLKTQTSSTLERRGPQAARNPLRSCS